MAKMGISTLQSYKGAQIFEAVGLNDEVIDRCFAGTASRIQGVDFDVLAEEVAAPARARLSRRRPSDRLPDAAQPGRVPLAGRRRTAHVGSAGDRRPAGRRPRQQRRRLPAVRRARQSTTRRTRCALRGLLKFKPGANGGPIPLDEVEPAKEIVKRFCTGAMSFGSISAEAHETLAIAMNRIGGKSNTGEGGEDPERFKPLPNGDSQALGDQAGRLGPVRRDDLVPDQRRRTADQDRARRQAGRRRRTARPQGRREHRPHPLLARPAWA